MKTYSAQLKKNIKGAASVPMVLIVFLISGIVLFYANRGLIFEQKTSANYYRSLQAFEAAEAGLEWALTMLGWQQVVGADCKAGVGNSFKERYIKFEKKADGNYYAGPTTAGLRSGCTINADGSLTCSCPTTGNPTLTGISTAPYFTVEFKEVASTPGMVAIEVMGCTASSSTNADARCVTGGTGSSDGFAVVKSQLALVSGLGSSPVATITSRGAVAMQGSGAAVGVYNPEASTNGITIDSGSTVNIEKAKLVTVPGSDPTASFIANDPALQVSADKLFESFFNMTKDAYKKMIINNGTGYLSCGTPPADCTISGADLVTAYNDGARNIWVDGALSVTGNITVGTPTVPVTVVVNGNGKFGGTTELNGFMYVMSDWEYTGGGSGFIRGAGVSEGKFDATNGSPDFYYQSNILETLTKTTGSFVKVPGSWIDIR